MWCALLSGVAGDQNYTGIDIFRFDNKEERSQKFQH